MRGRVKKYEPGGGSNEHPWVDRLFGRDDPNRWRHVQAAICFAFAVCLPTHATRSARLAAKPSSRILLLADGSVIHKADGDRSAGHSSSHAGGEV